MKVFSCKDILRVVTRIDKLKTWMEKEGIDSLLIDDPTDLFYLTGLTLSLGVLLVSEEIALFVDGRYIAKAKEKAPCSVYPIDMLKSKAGGKKTIAFDSASVSFDQYLELQRIFLDVPLIPLSKPLNALRGIKEPGEIEKLRQAQTLTKEAFEYIKKQLKVGITEEELAFEFEMFCRMCDKMSKKRSSEFTLKATIN